MQPEISIIIPSFNSRATIRQCLRSIAALRSAHSYEVILVDSSKDETPEIVRQEFPQVKLIHLEKQTHPGTARNLGIREARGEILAFTDSDCVVAPDWLDQIVAKLAEHRAAVVFGSLQNGTPHNLVGSTSFYMEFNEYLPSAPPRSSTILLGGNVGMRRHLFDEHKIFYNDLIASEDTLLADAIVKQGLKIFFDPAIQVTHLNRTELRGMLRHQFVLGKSSAEARRRSDLYGGIFVKYPVLCLTLPFARWLRAANRIIRNSFRDFLIFFGLTPLYLLAGYYWSFGFLSSARKPLDAHN